jgi:hypothetical protein
VLLPSSRIGSLCKFSINQKGKIMSNIPVGSCAAVLHALAAYPKAAVCLAILGLGGNTALSDAQLTNCNVKIAACQVSTPQSQKTAPTPVVTPAAVAAVTEAS